VRWSDHSDGIQTADAALGSHYSGIAQKRFKFLDRSMKRCFPALSGYRFPPPKTTGAAVWPSKLKRGGMERYAAAVQGSPRLDLPMSTDASDRPRPHPPAGIPPFLRSGGTIPTRCRNPGANHMAESTLKDNATAAKKLLGATARLAQKQAALATLNNVTLPKIYHAIGKKIVGLEKLPPDLVPHREKIRALEEGIATKPEQPKVAPAEGFAAKAKQLAQQAAQKASKASADAAATMQIQAAYAALGKQAVERYGNKAVPKDLVSGLTAAVQSRQSLEQEIDVLKGAARVGFLTPARALIGAVALGTVLFAYVFLFRGRGGNERIYKEFAESSSSVAGDSRGAFANSDAAGSGQQLSPHLAVAMLLGETSQHFRDTGFKGTTLGESFDQVNARTPLNHTIPGQPYLYATANGENFCFTDDNSLVCFVRSYEGGQEDYLAKLKELFGTTDKAILEREEVRSRSAGRRTYVRYTFPQVLVLLEFAGAVNLTGGLARQSEGTHVVFLDRNWAEGVLSRVAEAQQTCIDWVKKASLQVGAGKIDAAALDGLGGVRVHVWDGTRPGLSIVDLASEAKWKSRRGGADGTSQEDLSGQPIGSCGRAALARSLPAEVFFNIDGYEGAKVPVFLRAEATEDREGGQRFYAADHTPLLMLLVSELRCLQMQQMFPPKTDEIRFMQRKRAGMTMGSGWYEWKHEDENGGTWTVRSGTGDASIQLEFLGDRSL
jgi:hypothetical protein